jgi:hypothetical protein
MLSQHRSHRDGHEQDTAERFVYTVEARAVCYAEINDGTAPGLYGSKFSERDAFIDAKSYRCARTVAP